MKLVLVFLFVSALSFSQDSITRKERAKMYGTISVMMAPTILLLPALQATDKGGHIFFGVLAGVSIASGIMCLTNSRGKKVARNSSFVVAGTMDAFCEEILHHYNKVKSIFPSMNDQFWNPPISWNNKYTSKVPFATTLLVGTTDGWHGGRAVNKISVCIGMVLFDRNISFKQQVKQVLISSFFYTFAKGTTHYLIQN